MNDNNNNNNNNCNSNRVEPEQTRSDRSNSVALKESWQHLLDRTLVRLTKETRVLKGLAQICERTFTHSSGEGQATDFGGRRSRRSNKEVKLSLHLFDFSRANSMK